MYVPQKLLLHLQLPSFRSVQVCFDAKSHVIKLTPTTHSACLEFQLCKVVITDNILNARIQAGTLLVPAESKVILLLNMVQIALHC